MTRKLTLEQKSKIESLLLLQKAEFESMEKHGTFSGEQLFDPADERRSNVDERLSDVTLDAGVYMENHYLKTLAKINRCLERLDNKNFGACIDCDQQIGFQRLLAFPMAERCIECKTDFEKTHSE